ncbi:MAG: CopG family transcriptional regulator [Acidimicrobiia bacterium]
MGHVRQLTIRLPADMASRLRHEAGWRQVTVSALIREAIDAHLAQPTPRRRLGATGAGASGRNDISERIEAILTAEVDPAH